MKVLFVSWELDPLIKRGGLGDVAAALPAALTQLGVDIRIIIPYYKVLHLHKARRIKVGKMSILFGGKKESVDVYEIKHPTSAIPVYLLKNSTFLDIPRVPDTFPFFDKAVVGLLKKNILGWSPEIIHCNDHHAGYIPLILKEEKLPAKTILTLHNLFYQGIIPLASVEKLGYPGLGSRVRRWEGKVNSSSMLAEGIIHADVVNTVSPTYAKEITTPTFGMGMDEILRGKEGRLLGILNGIELPWKNNRYVKMPQISDWKEVKRHNKLFLQRKLKLKVGTTIPIFSFVGRFVPDQKGIDILFQVLQDSVEEREFEMILLGSGNSEWEDKFQWLSTFYPKVISTRFKFDDALAHEIYSAADFILIPSKFEPCGLIQMNAMQFGTLPIAHKTGGLADSIHDEVNGFLFDSYSSISLENTIEKALMVWKDHTKKFEKMVEAALATDFSWVKSAGKYREVYEKLLSGSL